MCFFRFIFILLENPVYPVILSKFIFLGIICYYLAKGICSEMENISTDKISYR
jgi:hypothetical protein